jgi:hypothetical protein
MIGGACTTHLSKKMQPRAPRAAGAAFAVFALAAALSASAPARAESPPASAASAASPASQAEALVVAMDASSEHLRHLLGKARTHHWTRGVGCLDEALSRVDVALRAGREEARASREAVHAGDTDGARIHLVRLQRLREMARAAASFGQMCAAGPELQPFEGTSVRVIVDPQIAPITP